MMKKVLTIITEPDGSFSWRKLMTGVATLLFTMAVVGYLIKHDFDEIPGSYQAIIAGVFLSYFGKNILANSNLLKKGKTSIKGEGHE